MTESEQKNGFPWAIVIGGPFLFLFLYVGSTGPITWFHSRGYFSGQTTETLEWFYSPLRVVYDNVEFVEVFLDWYMNLFV